jgi:uncharacterized tellurite resistance protein B-like protein
MKTNFTTQVQISSAALLLKVASSDDKTDLIELNEIEEILYDYFDLSKSQSQDILKNAKIEVEKSIDIFNFGEILNNSFDKEDKIEFVKCVLDVAHADDHYDHRERHLVSKIADILNLTKEDYL